MRRFVATGKVVMMRHTMTTIAVLAAEIDARERAGYVSQFMCVVVLVNGVVWMG